MTFKPKKQKDLLKHIGVESNTPDYQRIMRLKGFKGRNWFTEVWRLALVGYNVEQMIKEGNDEK